MTGVKQPKPRGGPAPPADTSILCASTPAVCLQVPGVKDGLGVWVKNSDERGCCRKVYERDGFRLDNDSIKQQIK